MSPPCRDTTDDLSPSSIHRPWPPWAGLKTQGKKGGTFCAAFLSAAGYTALGLTFTAPANNAAFAPGMKAASSVATLNDPVVADWEDHFQQTFHGLVIVAEDDLALGSALVAKIELLLVGAGGTVHHTQVGKAIRNSEGNGLEHFGYIDGRSQPLMLVEDIEQESRDEGIAHWDPSFPLTTALVPDPLGDDPEGLSFGSFFIFRKLKQDVRGFKTKEEELMIALNLTGEDRELAGALVVGRFEDGTPVTMSDEAKGLKNPHNDFDYQGDALASPARSTRTSARPTRAARAGSNRSPPNACTSWPAAASPTRTSSA